MNRPRNAMVIVAAALALSAASPVLAQISEVYVVHGIPGQDFGLDPALPVDIEVAGTCPEPLQGFSFGDRVGPLELPEGAYDITVRLADAQMPCSGDAVIALEGVALAAGANSTIIAHRTADGARGPGDVLGLGVTAKLFDNPDGAVERGKSRIVVHHTALAPAVAVVVSRDYDDPTAPFVRVESFANPTDGGDAVVSQIDAELRPGGWDVALELGGAAVFGPDRLSLRPFASYHVYAVGDFGGGSFGYLIFADEAMRPRGAAAAEKEERVKARRPL